jgi:hypothetical protein
MSQFATRLVEKEIKVIENFVASVNADTDVDEA